MQIQTMEWVTNQAVDGQLFDVLVFRYELLVRLALRGIVSSRNLLLYRNPDLILDGFVDLPR